MFKFNSIEKSKFARLCEVCSKLDLKSITRSPQPCREPMPCSAFPEDFLRPEVALGPIDEIKSRRFRCALCQIISESLDKEPPGLGGQCWMKETSLFCSFELPKGIGAKGSGITHYHITQASVSFETSVAKEFIGPAMPWESETQDTRGTHYILRFQACRKLQAGERDRSSSGTKHALDMIGGRYLGAQVDMGLIRAWLQQCESRHGNECNPSSRHSLRPDQSPTFVIDVINSCLVDTPPHCRYIALSYVWGTGTVFKHLQKGTQSLRIPGSFNSLPIPATIHDAATVTRAIGERYLWVDSICIIQDNLKMQQEEIMRMGSIYANALFTIIAASGDNANSGLSGVRPGSRKQLQKILKLPCGNVVSVIDFRSERRIDSTIWGERAWTFQERVLSPRVLMFSENQVYWSCHAVVQSEELALEEAHGIDRHHSPFPHPSTPCLMTWEPLDQNEYRVHYNDLLGSYRQRRLTFQTDLLNAFAGVSEVLAAVQKDKFIWGLPESQFSFAMTWHFVGQCGRNGIRIPVFGSDGTKEMVSVPSWSWSAWSGHDHQCLLVAGKRDVRPVVEFYVVDSKSQFVKIAEQPWRQHAGLRYLWKGKKPVQPPLPACHSPSDPGHLCFWTSLAKVKVIRHRGRSGELYHLDLRHDPPQNPFSTDGYTEIVFQDFIVVAARDVFLVLLAVEWRDGVAYRLGTAEVREEEWAPNGCQKLGDRSHQTSALQALWKDVGFACTGQFLGSEA